MGPPGGLHKTVIVQFRDSTRCTCVRLIVYDPTPE
jgi:hypothetical protein